MRNAAISNLSKWIAVVHELDVHIRKRAKEIADNRPGWSYEEAVMPIERRAYAHYSIVE